VRLERIVPGRPASAALVGAVLARDLSVGGTRWAKGRRLDAEDLDALAAATAEAVGAGSVTVLVMEGGDLHEDEAALRLADAVRGPGLERRGPHESRVDLVAEAAGVLHVRSREVELLDRIDPLEVFTALDGSVVSAGQLVASVKVAPHVVAASVVDRGIAITRGGRRPLVWVAPFVPMRVGVLVKESLRAADRTRFERSVRDKVESLGSTIVRFDYLPDESAAVETALASMTNGPSSEAVDVVLTAGGRSTDPSDPFFVALEGVGGRLIRRGVPAHPGSMLWLGRVRKTAVLGLPTCGAYSKATAADLLLPRLLTGEPPSLRTVSRLGHGGILTRDMRFRFPAYARRLDAPEG
jgi:Probable molybdopterin binding domain